MTLNASFTKVLVECSPSPGMFDTEVAVAIETVDGPVSLFADLELLDESGPAPALRTYASKDAALADPVSLLLPSEAFETGSRWIRVSPAKIRLQPSAG